MNKAERIKCCITTVIMKFFHGCWNCTNSITNTDALSLRSNAAVLG